MKKVNFDKVRKMVAEGLKNGLVTISDNLFDYGVMDIGCKIGDNAFYFGGNEVEDMSLEEYNVSFDDGITTEMVTNTIWDMIGSEDFSDEGWYYIYYLDENLKNINGGKNMKVKELAKKINGEIVSADSMQIYKDMDIGTAKPSTEEMQGIKHYMIDCVSPDERFSVADYKTNAKNAIEEIIKITGLSENDIK